MTSGLSNVYTMFGTVDTPMRFPAAFQVATPFGTNIGGVNPAMFAVNADSQYDSWLTVGMIDASNPSVISSIGIDFAAWTSSSGITATGGLDEPGGALFWMNPDAGPTGADIVMAQLTVPAGSSGTAGALLQGRSAHDADWKLAASWSYGCP